ncbi:MAG: leucine-rich repeat domain-containing protein [Muribaculaceae bacterium]|nr:leucine-rich repeat domain-containing protein [Muribaculaceae bacterium]
MTDNLLKKADRLRLLAMLLAVLCGFATASAQLYSDDINAAILVDGSVPVKWTNDSEHPWYIDSDSDGSYIRTPETEADFVFTSTLTFTYSSAYPTEISFKYRRYERANEDELSLIVDGEQRKSLKNSSWTSDANKAVVLVPAGNHTVQLRSSSNYKNSYNSNYWGGIRDIRVWECKELESACLKEGSLPLNFDNDNELNKMWVTEDGYVRSQRGYSSKTSTTFTIEKPSLFGYQMMKGNNSSYYTTSVYVDGVVWDTNSDYKWKSGSVVLLPGTHTVEFVGESSDKNYTNSVHLREIRLEQNWYEVTLNTPGELGTRLTQVMEGQPIQNMELLKINGAMNSDDWAKLKLATGIRAIDFTQTGITEVPASACEGRSHLSTVMLPETVTKIGNKAFYGTNFYQINIPSSVETIGNEVWRDTPLLYISFMENSKLSSIGEYTFRGTRIMEFDMPNTVTSIGSYLFYNCTALTKLHLSEGLTIIPSYTAYQCAALKDINIPSNLTDINSNAFYKTGFTSVDLPESLQSIGSEAFAYSSLEYLFLPKNVSTLGEAAFEYSSQLKEIHLNSHCWNMNYTFSSCTALEKVILPCATPPTIKIGYYSEQCDPFRSVTKSNVTLVVPDFAFDTYRADSYWYNFRNTIKGDEASINDYWAIRGTLNLNNTLVMRGNPSVEMMTGSVLTLDSNSEQTFNEFTYKISETSPATVLSQSNSLKANQLVTEFYVGTKDKWFFFSPVTDVNMREVSYTATDSWVIRYYDGARRANQNATSGNWVNVPSDGVLKGGQGYIFQAKETGWLRLPAASTSEHDKFFGSNQVNYDLADNACETEANAGWNFVANPYPTYYDIYYIDMQAPITVWTGSTYKAYSLNDGDRGDDTFVLRPMQPFFVQKSTADLSTGMPLVGRQVNTTIDRSRAPRPATVDENRHKLNLELFCDDNEEADDYTRVVLNEQASLAYETVRDASKFMTMNADVAQLYTLGSEGHPMAINERPYEDGNVALGVLLPAADRTYRISARRADRKAWLYDAETGMEADLTEGDYFFTASKTGIDNKRFSIRFAPTVNSVEGVDATDAVKVIGGTGSISVSAPAGSAVTVFATDGSVITNTEAENGIVDVPVAGGVYVVKVNGESYKTIVK